MLTADLVRARRRGDELRLVPLDAALRAHAEELAAAYLELATSHVGRAREEFEETCDAVRSSARDQRLADGLCKLVDDRCEFEADATVAAEEMRRDVFVRASAGRRVLPAGARFDRQAVIDTVAQERGISPDAVERGLYADLRAAHLLRSVEAISARRLVDEYEQAQAQAVLLRAVRVVVEVECAMPGAYRALFRKLKFLRLLHSIQAREGGGYRIVIDGPFSLFESGTKYGLQLALALPAVRECDAWKLSAEVRWGIERAPLKFRLEGKASSESCRRDEPARLPDDVAVLVRGIQALETSWRVEPATVVLDLPGVGVCVPDLVFEHEATGERVYLEVLGYWSRDAVWRRVELVNQGLGERIVFAVGKHLRVSEAALEDGLPGALYVYKRTMLAKAVVERVEAVRGVARVLGNHGISLNESAVATVAADTVAADRRVPGPKGAGRRSRSRA